MDADKAAKLITSVCERFMRTYLLDLPELVELRRQAQALFPYHLEDGVMVTEANVLDRIEKLERAWLEVANRLQAF